MLPSKLPEQVQFPHYIPYNTSRFWRTVTACIVAGLYYGLGIFFASDKAIVIVLILLLTPVIGAFLYYEVLNVPHYLILEEERIILKKILSSKIYEGLIKVKVEERWIDRNHWKEKKKTLVLLFGDGQELLIPDNDMKWSLRDVAEIFVQHYQVTLTTGQKLFLDK
jgi:phage shock protein PspC (stress-responsive transcriptional regulator)